MLTAREPKNVFRFFEEISRIPRGSGNEKGVSDYLIAFAQSRGLWFHRDDALNVVVKKPGTKGMESAPPVILQGHMDMVCEKNAGVAHDFEKDPLRLIVDGDFLRADGTTLGADNGAALALALAALDGDDLAHPPLEALFTSGEETGLLGAAKVDGALFEGRLLINLDSGEEGFFCACCAGGARVDLSYAPEYRDLPPGHVVKTLTVDGLKGGHSGMDIAKERANANRLMGRALGILRAKQGVHLVAINGGSKENAIPRDARADVALPAAKDRALADEVERIGETFRREYAASDAGLRFRLEEGRAESASRAFAPATSAGVVAALLLLPNGVQAMSATLKGLPETSLNIGVVTTTENGVVISSCLRSSVGSRKAMLLDQANAVAEVTGARVSVSGLYPEWEYNADSALRKKAMDVFAKTFGKEAQVHGTHGGLECGILGEKIPGADIVSFGPDIHEMHSPNEKMSIPSFGRTWTFLTKLLAALGGP